MRKRGSNVNPTIESGAAGRKMGLLDHWCFLAHDDITWPAHGRYHCKRCHRVFRVPWDEGQYPFGAGAGRARDVASPETVAA
jgi:hypothetical protein